MSKVRQPLAPIKLALKAGYSRWQGEDICALRTRLGISQRTLAWLLDVRPNTINRWEKPLQPVSITTALALRKLEELFDSETDRG